MPQIAINYASPRKQPIVPRLMIGQFVAVVLLIVLIGWLAFSCTMIGRDLLRHLPASSHVQVFQNGAMEITAKDAAGNQTTQMVEPWSPAVIPVVGIPLVIVTGLAIYGCYALTRKKGTLASTHNTTL